MPGDAETMRALIERVEQAQGPDREIDLACHTALALPLGKVCDDNGRLHPDWSAVPRYTASLDAAVSLVPEGWAWLRKTPQTMTVYEPPQDEKAWAVHIDGAASTPALALVAAALRARLVMEAKDE